MVIEVTSASMTDLENAFNFVLKKISKAKNLTVTKCRINGTNDKVTAVKPQTLKDLVAKNILIHFHKCKLSYDQAEAFAGTDCSLILDKSSIGGLGKFLFLGEGGCVCLAFIDCCSKFSILLEHTKAGKLKALVLLSIDLLCVYPQKEGEPLGVLTNLAISELNTRAQWLLID